MDEFLKKFFPSVYKKHKISSPNENQYCKFENHLLTLFTSSLYITALFASFFASATTTKFGRKTSMTVGGLVILGRLLLALAAVPAAIMTAGALFLPDTPNSIIQRGKTEEAKEMLQKIRCTEDVDDKLRDMLEATEAAANTGDPWVSIVEPRHRPQLVITFLIPVFQQLTGINVVMFYAPVLFKTLGFGDDAALMSAVVMGVVNLFATLVSVAMVDRFGRRALFIEGGIQMAICQVSVGVVIYRVFGGSGVGSLSTAAGNVALALMCVYVAAFAWSWLVPSEIHPLETRSAGQSINVAVNMGCTFVVGQAFLTMLCRMKYGVFFFFAAWLAVMTVVVFLFVPETKGMPIEEMNRVWKAHWFWHRYIPDDALGLPSLSQLVLFISFFSIL